MIDYDYEELLLSSSVHKDIVITDGTLTYDDEGYDITGETVTITNSELDEEAFSLTEKLCGDSELRFGRCCAATLQFTMHGNIDTLKGKVLSVWMYLDGDTSTMMPMGTYIVDEEKLQSDRTVRSITAYGSTMYILLNTDVTEWYNSLLPNANSSTTISAMRASLFSQFGITAESATLVNDSMVVKRTINPTKISGGDIIRAICEINGCFGMVTRENKFRFVELSPGIDSGVFPATWLYPSTTLYPSEPNPDVTDMTMQYYTDIDYEGYNASSITQLQIRTNQSDVGTIVGTVGNRYVISNNFLVYGKTASELTTIANNLLPKITGRYYAICSANCVGNPCHEVGDAIRIHTTYANISTYILERRLVGIQALKDTYTAQGTETYTEDLTSVESQYEQLAGRITQLKVDSDGIEGRVEDIENGTASVIQQLSNSISAKVSETGGSQQSFAWSLLYNAFQLISNGNVVFKCDANGIEVKGKIGAVGSDTKVATMTSNGLSVEDADGLGTEVIDYGSDSILVRGIGSHMGVFAPFLDVEWVTGQTYPKLILRCATLNGGTPVTSENWQDIIPNGNGVSY